MKIIEAISRTDELKTNDYEQSEKVRWLAELDNKIYEEIIKTHEGGCDVTYTPYTADTALDTTELLADDAYAEMYIAWLSAKIDLNNAEIGKYNNQITEFNALYSAFWRWYNRTHAPKNTAIRYY